MGEVEVVRDSSASFVRYLLAKGRVLGTRRVIWLCPQCSLLSSDELRRTKKRGKQVKKINTKLK